MSCDLFAEWKMCYQTLVHLLLLLFSAHIYLLESLVCSCFLCGIRHLLNWERLKLKIGVLPILNSNAIARYAIAREPNFSPNKEEWKITFFCASRCHSPFHLFAHSHTSYGSAEIQILILLLLHIYGHFFFSDGQISINC